MASESGRHALAGQLAEDAARRAEDPSLAARALLVAMEEADDGGDLVRAAQLAERIASTYPLSEQASVAELAARRFGRRLAEDPRGAALALAELAGRDDLAPHARSLAAARIVRDRLGDAERASELFEAAKQGAQSPTESALASAELARSQEAHALGLALDGDDEGARRALRTARSNYADAAAQAGGGDGARAGLLGLVRLELALAAAPERPWLFDAERAPLLGAVGVAETVDLRSERFDALRTRLASALERGLAGDDRAWLEWRAAELSPSQLDAHVDAGLAAASDVALRLRLEYTRAVRQLQGEDADAAIGRLRDVVETERGGELSVAARYLLAERHRAARRYDPAARLYAQVAGAVPSTQKGQRSLLLAGDCELYAGRPEAALDRYADLLERSSGSRYEDDALYRLGTAQLRLSQMGPAEESFRRLAAWPGETEYAARAHAKLADIRQRRGDLSGAREELAAAVALDREFAAAEGLHLRLAELALEAEDPEDAARWIDRRDDVVEADAASLGVRVRAAAAGGDLGRARDHLERLSLGYPGESTLVVDATLALAEALDEAGERAEAIELFDRARGEANGAQRARAEYGAGLASLRAGDVGAARRRFEAVRESASESEWGAQALFKLGQIHQRSQEDRDAQAAFTELVRRHPQHPLAPDALRAEARAWRALGRYDEALTRYHALLEEHPDVEDGEQILAHIAYCHHEMGQFELSIAAYRRVMPMLGEEDRGYAQFWIADSYEQLGRFEEAAAEYLRIPYEFPRLGELPVTAQLKAGGVYERMGEVEAARRIYQKVLDAHGPGGTWGTEAQKRLDRIASAAEGES